MFSYFLKELYSYNNRPVTYNGYNESYIKYHEAIISLIYSIPQSEFKWNNLTCGGAYLNEEEYSFLRNIVKSYNIKKIIESGAGETSILFKSLGVDSLSIEYNDGPWNQKAIDFGCNVKIITFSEETLKFDNYTLENTINNEYKDVDLIFLGSPNGTKNRSLILFQLLESGLVNTKYVLFHDSHRDSPNIYNYQAKLGLNLLEYCSSIRGLCFFETHKEPPVKKMKTPNIEHKSGECNIYIEAFCLSDVIKNDCFKLKILIINKGSEILSSNYNNPVYLSYHWYNHDKSDLKFENPRHILPCDIYPEDKVEMSIELDIVSYEGLIKFDLVQEYVRWFNAQCDYVTPIT